jgi:AcrR family transcriptional regulator
MLDHIRTFIKDKQLVSERRAVIGRRAWQVFAKYGYNKTNLRQIAEACKMSVGTIYRYVGSKEDILYLVIDQSFTSVIENTEDSESQYDVADATQALMESIDRFFREIDRIQGMILFAYQEIRNLSAQSRERIFDKDRLVVAAFAKLLANGCEKGQFSISNVELIAQSIVALGGMWAVRRWALRKSFTLEEYIKVYTEVLLRGIRRETN